MKTTSRTSALKLPTEPYPGLRPFLDHESALLLGRKRQVQEVIDRLRQTQFVAVIGGSGSGKSSLIRAGVVPELRGLGIPDAGDYWVPVICTPGTTGAATVRGAAADDGAALVAQTPITRLAWKFSQVLAPADEVLKKLIAAGQLDAPKEPIDPEVEAATRRAEIETVFRQGAGFSRLVKAYADELPALGPAHENARFMFVIDQFEELFHPNNRGNDDTRTLIEAVIEHFFSPDPHCYVVLTMRSEHLADCAAYLELPDAINKSSYLVRRLDEPELREAIVGPAKYFLRLRQRGADARPGTLPDDIVFDELVIQRLLADVTKITGDADHLPLLQHILARIWECACARESASGRLMLPARILWRDLEQAVEPGMQRPLGWLHENGAVNALRDSLENWAQAAYDAPAHSAEDRRSIDVVLRQLAFKDPNSGLYSQQRVDVDDPKLFGREVQPARKLRELFEHGFLDSVNYLFWDAENPDRVTLKVSHEAFVRGWSHFRSLVDAEADRFDEFVAVLRKCATWTENHKPDRLLLEASELSRLEDSKLVPVFKNESERKDWFRVLVQYREGERLTKIEPQVDVYLEASRARQHEREQAERDRVEHQREAEERERLAIEQRQAAEALQRQNKADAARARAEAQTAEAERLRAKAVGNRNGWLAISAIAVAGVLLGYAAFPTFIYTPALHGIEKFAEARRFTERRERTSGVYPVIGAANKDLGMLLRAATLIVEAGEGESTVLGNSNRVRKSWAWLDPVSTDRIFELSSSDPVVNGSLRNLLTSVVWHSPPTEDRSKEARQITASDQEAKCTVTTRKPQDSPSDIRAVPGESQGTKEASGWLFPDNKEGRRIFVPSSDILDDEMRVYNATVVKRDTEGATTCKGDTVAWSVPMRLDPYVLFDAETRFMALANGQYSTSEPSVSLYSINWGPSQDGKDLVAKFNYRSVVTDPSAVRLVIKELDPKSEGLHFDWRLPRVRSVASWPELNGTGVLVAGEAWRLFSDASQSVEMSDNTQGWVPLQQPKSGCKELGDVLAKRVQPEFDSTSKVLQLGDLCFQIKRGNPAKSEQALRAQGEQVLVAVYNRPLPQDIPELGRSPPAAIASIEAFGRFAPGPDTWFVGTKGAYEGWIALQHGLPDKPPVYSGAPWSTSALLRLGCAVYRPETFSSPSEAPAPPRCPAASAK